MANYRNDSSSHWERMAKIALQFGAAAIGFYLVWFFTWRLDARTDAISNRLAEHVTMGAQLSQEMQRQTDISQQTCVLLARIAKSSPDPCFPRRLQ